MFHILVAEILSAVTFENMNLLAIAAVRPHVILTTAKSEDKRSLKVTHCTSYFTGLLSGQEQLEGKLFPTKCKSTLAIAPEAPGKGITLQPSTNCLGTILMAEHPLVGRHPPDGIPGISLYADDQKHNFRLRNA